MKIYSTLLSVTKGSVQLEFLKGQSFLATIKEYAVMSSHSFYKRTAWKYKRRRDCMSLVAQNNRVRAQSGRVG